MNDETLGESVVEIVTMMVLVIVLAMLVMGALGISLRPIPEASKHPRPAVVHPIEPKDHPKHSDVGLNP